MERVNNDCRCLSFCSLADIGSAGEILEGLDLYLCILVHMDDLHDASFHRICGWGKQVA
jgi:hypothetical protein